MSVAPGPHEPVGAEEPESATPDGLENPPAWIGAAAFATLGTTIALCEAAGVALGIWADHVGHSSPAGLLIGIALGTVAAVVSVVKQVRRFL